MIGVVIGLVSAITLFVFLPQDPQAVQKLKDSRKKEE